MELANFKFKNRFLKSKKKSPYLMIVLHGKGDSYKPFLHFDSELDLSSMNFLILNAPKKYLDGYSWYGDPPFLVEGVQQIRQDLFEVLEELELMGWKSKNIFFLGFSQGCLISVDFALHYPKKLAGVIGISGYFYFFPRWRSYLNKKNAKTPWLFTHGKNDDVLPFANTFFGVKKMQQAGLQVNWLPSNKRHTFPSKEFPLIKKWILNQISS
ncbi:MAG: alpha/beta hydrolase [Pseudobdellovibrionaceae bacterium]